MATVRSDGQVFNATNVSFLSCLWAIKPGTLEDKVQILWNSMLNTWFPPTQPYTIAIKAAALPDNTMLDAVLFEIHFLQNQGDSRDIHEQHIFTLQCKRMSEDTAEGWESAKEQLRYLKASDKDTSRSGRYGAVAIGSKVVFYEWTSTSGQLFAISRCFDLLVPEERPLVEDQLNHVKQIDGTREAS